MEPPLRNETVDNNVMDPCKESLPMGSIVVPFGDCLLNMNPRKELLWSLWVTA